MSQAAAPPLMHHDLRAALAALRARRGFDPGLYVRAKTALLERYLARAGVRACVVGVSGGIDSAVTLALAAHAARRPGSPIARVVAALVPLFVSEGATHQHDALARGREVARAYGVEIAEVDLSEGFAHVRASAERGLAQGPGTAWAAGQLVSYLRTPALYYLTALLAEQGAPAVLLGTTNRDEGGYLGFFGKASDGMVDIQVISDAHKSEVYAVARRLGVPASALDAVPTGDTYDGRSDEQMIGAPYDFVELYGLYRSLLDRAGRERLRAGWSAEARARFDAWAALLEARHARNAHKYVGDSPAVHLDVYPRAVPGGWREDDAPLLAPDGTPPPPRSPSRFVGEFALDRALVGAIATARAPDAPPPRREALRDYGESAFVLADVLSGAECDALLGALAAQPRVPVGRNGMLDGYAPARGDAPGSFRASAYDPELARALWARLAGAVPMARVLEPDTPTDGHDHPAWRAAGISPLFRFIEYREGGLLVPHYDSGYDFGDGRRLTLASVVIYLTDAPDPALGGATRLLCERQRHLPAVARRYADGDAPARPRDVLARVAPRRGAALVFDHRVPHDAEPWRGAHPRVVVRTDLVYERAAPRALYAPATATTSEPSSELPPDTSQPLVRKALRDAYYGPAYPLLGSLAALEHAGFFDDGAPAPPDEPAEPDIDWLVTPLDKAAARLEALLHDEARAGDAPAPLAVLVTTGALCPVHRGHLAMMEHARAELERRGTRVLAGYLAPDHDAYVLAKCGGDTPGAAHRVRLCERAVAASDWLMVDPWAALHVDRAVNFTDVLARLERYLAAHLRCHRRVDVAFVFGSDNARFALTFAARGRGVCVPRPGYDDRLAAVAAHPLVRDNPRVVLLDARAAAPDAASSTAVRAGDDDALAPAVRATWRAWQRAETGVGAREVALSVRDEGDWAIAPWLARGGDPASVRAARAAFVRGLLAALERAFADARPPDAPRRVLIATRALAEERARAHELTRGQRVLSLDPCIPGDVDLGVSRCFELASGAAREGLVARPGCPPLAAQLAALPAGAYALLDDDTATGHTLASVRALLPPRCAIARVVTLCGPTAPAPDPAHITELLDARDFLAGAREAGLVVALPDGALARVPYALPYARPADRVSVPASSELAFSRAVWALNAAFFDAVAPALRVADAAPAFRALCDYLGFADATPLAAVARWHLARCG